MKFSTYDNKNFNNGSVHDCLDLYNDIPFWYN